MGFEQAGEGTKRHLVLWSLRGPLIQINHNQSGLDVNIPADRCIFSKSQQLRNTHISANCIFRPAKKKKKTTCYNYRRKIHIPTQPHFVSYFMVFWVPCCIICVMNGISVIWFEQSMARGIYRTVSEN